MRSAEDIRSHALEVLGRAEFETTTYREQTWEEIPEETRGRLRRLAEPLVGALAAAGLLPTAEIRTDGITALAAFLNSRNGDDTGEMTMQILKLQEEVGEVAAAWIGHRGQNPRKGRTHDLDDVLGELADVAIPAMVGIARLGGNPADVVGGKVAVMEERYARLEVTE